MLTARNLREYFDDCAKSSNKEGVLAFPEHSEQYAGLKYYTNEEVDRYVAITIHYLFDHRLEPAPNDSSKIGISAPGTIEWLVTFIALSRLGYTVLALSKSLSTSTLTKLLQKAECTTIITDKDSSPSPTAVHSIPIIPRTTLIHPPRHVRSLEPLLARCHIPHFAFIWHSSGTTSTPKLFPMTQSATIPRLDSVLARNNRSVWLGSAAYHSAGLTFLLASLALPSGRSITFSNDRLPPTGEGLMALLKEAKPTSASPTPAQLELLVSAPGGLEMLKKCVDSVNVFGAVCPKYLGDSVVRAGVRLSVSYAMSEGGTLLNSIGRKEEDLELWEWMSVAPGIDREKLWFRPLKQEGEWEVLYELVILKGVSTCPPELSNSDEPPGSFHTGDVFLRHPDGGDRWKIVGRTDDRFSLGTGATVNAMEYEEAIKEGCKGKGIDEVVLFGQGRKKLGLLSFVMEKSRSDFNADDVRNVVWEVVQGRINGDPRFQVGIEEDMILAVPAHVSRTDKGNVKRAATYLQFQDMIDQAYSKDGSHI